MQKVPGWAQGIVGAIVAAVLSVLGVNATAPDKPPTPAEVKAAMSEALKPLQDDVRNLATDVRDLNARVRDLEKNAK